MVSLRFFQDKPLLGNTPNSVVVKFGNKNTVIHSTKCLKTPMVNFPLSIAFVIFSSNSIIAMEVDIFCSDYYSVCNVFEIYHNTI